MVGHMIDGFLAYPVVVDILTTWKKDSLRAEPKLRSLNTINAYVHIMTAANIMMMCTLSSISLKNRAGLPDTRLW